MIQSIESGTLLKDVLREHRALCSRNGCSRDVAVTSSELYGFVVQAFVHQGLTAPPKEDSIVDLLSAFSIDQGSNISLKDYLCFTEALMRVVFLSEAPSKQGEQQTKTVPPHCNETASSS